jgi:large subunit ribosomal protein L30
MKKLKVTLKRSLINTSAHQRATARGLGLGKLNHGRVLENTTAVRGMVKQVLHLVDVEEIDVAGE